MRESSAMAVPRASRDIANSFFALGEEQLRRILLLFEPEEALNIAQIAAVAWVLTLAACRVRIGAYRLRGSRSQLSRR